MKQNNIMISTYDEGIIKLFRIGVSKMNKSVFSKKELKFLIGISFAIGFVQFSLGLIAPFVSTYASNLKYTTPALVGLSLGIYGLTQGILQLPYGMWSDRIGRKTVLLTGLMQMILGFFLGYIAQNIYTFIIARALQGSGAIMAVAYSWIGDSISDEKKNRAMGTAGMIVGLAAAGAFGLGPILYKLMSVPKIFLMCAFLALLGWIYILIFMKNDKVSTTKEMDKVSLKDFLRHKSFNSLVRITIAGFITDYILFTVYFIVPLLLQKYMAASDMWKVFLPSIVIAIIVLKFASNYADKGYFIKVNKYSFLVALLGSLCFFVHNVFLTAFGMILSMTAFMCLISLLPSGVNKLTEENIRGSANGLLNTFIFFGAFVGGSLSGLLWNINSLFPALILTALSFIGFLLIAGIKEKL